MSRFWMVRAGEGGIMAEDFADKSVVAVGWPDAGDLSRVDDLDSMRELVARAHPGMSKGAVINSAAVLHKIRSAMQVDDRVLTYDPERRDYRLGRVKTEYQYRPDYFDGYPNVRAVAWESRVSRDDLSTGLKNTLGCRSTCSLARSRAPTGATPRS